eukprot:SAG11_NODE_1800_length_4243_cov_4.590734_3_plen_125_part_00
MPLALEGSGFTAPSALTYDQCVDAGREWCPLRNDTATYASPGGGALEYYHYSVCCTGSRARALQADAASGLPSCGFGVNTESCTRLQVRSFLQFLYALCRPASFADPPQIRGTCAHTVAGQAAR